MAKTDEITVQGYEAPDQVDINIKEEVPSPPGGASRWAEFTEDKPQWGNASWWGNVGERAKAVLPYLKDNAKTYGALATDVWAKDILPNAVGKVYGGLTGVDSEDDYEDYDVDESRMPPLGPHYRPQSLDDYIVRRRDMKPSTEDVMSGRANVGGSMENLNPSREYPGMLEAGALADVDASNAEVGRGGRFLGNLVNRLQGDFETSDKEDENAYRKALAAGQGALGYLSDTLPDQLEALAGEGGARLGMAALGPAFIKAKKLREKYLGARREIDDLVEAGYGKDQGTRRLLEYDIDDALKRQIDLGDQYDKQRQILREGVARRRVGEGVLSSSEKARAKGQLPTDLYQQYIKDVGKNELAADRAYRELQFKDLSSMTQDERADFFKYLAGQHRKAGQTQRATDLDKMVQAVKERRTLSPQDRTAALKAMDRNARKVDGAFFKELASASGPDQDTMIINLIGKDGIRKLKSYGLGQVDVNEFIDDVIPMAERGDFKTKDDIVKFFYDWIENQRMM